MNFPNKRAITFQDKYLINDQINSVYFVDLQSFCRSLTDKDYGEILNSKTSVVFSDGFFVHKVLKKQGSSYYPGPEFLKRLFSHVDNILFLGPTKTGMDELQNSLLRKSLNVKVDFLNIPFYDTIADLDLARLENDINMKGIKHIAVILGCPKQEILISKLANDNNDYVFYGLGAAFNFFIGSEKRIPEVLVKFKIEWLYRLLLNPYKQFPKYILVAKSIPALLKYISKSYVSK